MPPKKLSTFLLIVTILFVVLALATLWPSHQLMISDLGYYALCPFAPWSTLGLLFLAGLSWIIYRHLRSL
jgi:hypothetical protein